MATDTLPPDPPFITADRPGIGSDAEVIPQFTLQPEMGVDGREVRAGIAKGFEVDRDDADWAVKASLIDTDKLKASLRVSYGHTVTVEVPANISFNKYFNLGLDAAVPIARRPGTYAAEFNITPTTRLTLTPTLYYDTKPRASIFVAWIPPQHNNIQFDIGYADRAVTAGIAVAVDFTSLMKGRR